MRKNHQGVDMVVLCRRRVDGVESMLLRRAILIALWSCLTIEIIERLLAACDWRRLVVWLAIVHRVLSGLYLGRIAAHVPGETVVI